MEKDTRLHENYEKSRLLMMLAIGGGVLNLLGIITVAVLGVTTLTKYGTWAGSDVFALMIIPFSVATLYAIAAAVYGSMAKSAYQEEEDKHNLEKRKESHAAFDVNEDVRFTSGRSFMNFRKYAPYVIAIIAAILIFSLMFSCWSAWHSRQAAPIPVDSMYTAAVSFIIMLISMLGTFFIGQSKDELYRWLRPMGAWMIAAGIIALLSLIGSICYSYKMLEPNEVLAKIAFVCFGVLGIELILSFITEFYRPRSLEAPRPVFESRFLALFTEPGGVARNIANTLDYQFGFKVSGTWIYSFLERALFRMLIAWFLVLWAFTCISEVGPNEVGIKMSFGKIVNSQPLEPGVYLKWPFPFGKVLTYSCDEVHQIFIGAEMVGADGKKSRPEVVSWGKQHYAKEVNYLVASETDDKSTTPVSQIGSSIPLQYRIRKSQLNDYAFRNQDAAGFLKNIGEQITSKYFASVSIFDIMSSGRGKAADDLKRLIQAEADRLRLGLEIVRVNIHDAHPPEGVAAEFQNVVGAMEEMETMGYEAKAYVNKVIPGIEASKSRILADATSYSYQVKAVSKAESERFERQMTAYKVLPQYFMLRSYLDMLERDGNNARKYIMSGSLEYEIYELNFEKKGQLDLIDTDLGELSR